MIAYLGEASKDPKVAAHSQRFTEAFNADPLLKSTFENFEKRQEGGEKVKASAVVDALRALPNFRKLVSQWSSQGGSQALLVLSKKPVIGPFLTEQHRGKQADVAPKEKKSVASRGATGSKLFAPPPKFSQPGGGGPGALATFTDRSGELKDKHYAGEAAPTNGPLKDPHNVGKLKALAAVHLDTDKIEKKIIIAFGDSLTRGGNPKNPANTGIKGYVPFLEDLLFDHVILNCGIGGETTTQGRQRLGALLNGSYGGCTRDTQESGSTAEFYDYSKYEGQKPYKVLIMEGSNDTLQKFPLELTLANLRAMIQMAKSAGVEPYLAMIPPVAGADYRNAVIRQVAHEGKVVIADMYAALKPDWQKNQYDGLHVNAAGNLIMAERWLAAAQETAEKPPFPAGSCTTGTGYKVPSGLKGCSCASGTVGMMFTCAGGTFVANEQRGALCVRLPDRHEVVTYHCPELIGGACRMSDGTTVAMTFCAGQQ